MEHHFGDRVTRKNLKRNPGLGERVRLGGGVTLERRIGALYLECFQRVQGRPSSSRFVGQKELNVH